MREDTHHPDTSTGTAPGVLPSSTKYVFVTGGVVSSLGKGIVAASLGRLLKARGLNVVNQKLDPYINVDPGTMNPYEHGEVFVTDDGGETDLDLGHYERFTSTRLTRHSSVTTGSVYQAVIAAERRGDYLGATVQVIPHITDEIKRRIHRVAQPEVDVVIVEVGGTVGDIESLPFLEAIRQFGNDVGRRNAVFIHVTLVPHLGTSDELKTKPTQHSVAELRSHGIHPDVVVLRADRPIDEALRAKISLFCDVPTEAVIACPDAPSIYHVPAVLHSQGLDQVVCDRLEVFTPPADLEDWNRAVARMDSASRTRTVAVVGKYVGLRDAYLSVVEALRHAGAAYGIRPELRWVSSDQLESGDLSPLDGIDALVVPGGFGSRGVEGKIAAIHHARTAGIPFLGLCLGMQCAVVEFARNVCGLEGANSAEFDPDTPYPVIDLMESQYGVSTLGGTMRLGLQPAKLTPDTKTHALYGRELVYERHRHRYEVNPRFILTLVTSGLVISGQSPDNRLVEHIELADHPFFVATQAHPEFLSRPDEPHPLFVGLMADLAD